MANTTMEDHTRPPPTTGTYRRKSLPVDSAGCATRKAIYELLSDTDVSQSPSEHQAAIAEPPVKEAIQWVSTKASIRIEPIEDSESRLQRDEADLQRYEEDLNAKAAFLQHIVKAPYLGKAEQDAARTSIQEMRNTIAKMLLQARGTQLRDFEQTRELMRGVGVAYAALGAKADPSKFSDPAPAQPKAATLGEDERTSNSSSKIRRGGIRPERLNLGARPREQVNLIQILSDGVTTALSPGKSDKPATPERQTQSPQGSEGVRLRMGSINALSKSAQNPVGNKASPTAKACGTATALEKGGASPSFGHQGPQKGGPLESTPPSVLSPSPGSSEGSGTSREHQPRPRTHRKNREVIHVKGENEDTLHFPGTPEFLSWRKNRDIVVTAAHDAPTDELPLTISLDDLAAPEDVTTVLAPSASSSILDAEASPTPVVVQNDVEHHVQEDGNNLAPPEDVAADVALSTTLCTRSPDISPRMGIDQPDHKQHVEKPLPNISESASSPKPSAGSANHESVTWDYGIMLNSARRSPPSSPSGPTQHSPTESDFDTAGHSSNSSQPGTPMQNASVSQMGPAEQNSNEDQLGPIVPGLAGSRSAPAGMSLEGSQFGSAKYGWDGSKSAPAGMESSPSRAGSARQSSNGSSGGQRRRRTSLFRESFLVEKVDPSWSLRVASCSEDVNSSDDDGWYSVSITLFDATWMFLANQLLPWLHVLCFAATLTHACLYSVVEMSLAPINNMLLRFGRYLANPLPVPVVSEVPQRSQLVVATHTTVAMGLITLFKSYRLERLRESWLEANGMTRVLFVDYLRAVGVMSWRSLPATLLRGFDVHQAHNIGKL